MKSESSFTTLGRGWRTKKWGETRMRDADFTLVQDLSCLPDKWPSAMGLHKSTQEGFETPPRLVPPQGSYSVYRVQEYTSNFKKVWYLNLDALKNYINSDVPLGLRTTDWSFADKKLRLTEVSHFAKIRHAWIQMQTTEKPLSGCDWALQEGSPARVPLCYGFKGKPS